MIQAKSLQLEPIAFTFCIYHLKVRLKSITTTDIEISTYDKLQKLMLFIRFGTQKKTNDHWTHTGSS